MGWYHTYDATRADVIAELLTCPLAYLDMTPEVNPDWRAGVRRYHRNRKPRTVAKC